MAVEDVLLEGELDVDAQGVLGPQDLQGVVPGEVEDGLVVDNEARRDGPQDLVDEVGQEPVPYLLEEGELYEEAGDEVEGQVGRRPGSAERRGGFEIGLGRVGSATS